MTFEIPIAPTISETSAMASSNADMVRLDRSRVAASCRRVVRSRLGMLPASVSATFG